MLDDICTFGGNVRDCSLLFAEFRGSPRTAPANALLSAAGVLQLIHRSRNAAMSFATSAMSIRRCYTAVRCRFSARLLLGNISSWGILAPEKFHFLLVFLVILAIILLMFLFNIIKKYFTGDVYTPQMYVSHSKLFQNFSSCCSDVRSQICANS